MAKTYDSLYLVQNGWYMVGRRHNGINQTHYWSHRDHQPDRHGFFTQTSALAHQKMLDKNGGVCDCIKETS